MHTKILPILATIFLAVIIINLASALIVDADYITIYPGESGDVDIEVENNGNFDIEDVSVQLILINVLPDGTSVSLPFSVIGSSKESLGNLDEDDDDSATFKITAFTEIIPGDYNIPYLVTYVDAEGEDYEQTGTFGLRVSAKTDLDFTVDTRENSIVGNKGRLSLEIINKGLGDLKSMSVEIFPEGFELLSKSKIFVGTVDSDDADLASFDVIYTSTIPLLRAKITYKDFDNNEQIETVNLPFKVYTREEALELELVKKSKTGFYGGIVILLIIIWIIYRKVKKSRKRKTKRE